MTEKKISDLTVKELGEVVNTLIDAAKNTPPIILETFVELSKIASKYPEYKTTLGVMDKDGAITITFRIKDI